MDIIEKKADFPASEYEKYGFVSVKETIPDAVMDIRYCSDHNFVGAPIDSYEAPVAYLTVKAAQALKGVGDALRERGYLIKIFDCYRPQSAVDHFKRWAEDLSATEMKWEFYPDVDKADLFKKGFIAERSSHSRGSTVDLTIVDALTGRDVDMGGEFDFFGELSHSYYTKTLSEEQISNRKILREAMMAGGFTPLLEEWWHYTLRDEPYPDTYFDFPVADVAVSVH